jgi:hypothetical protein
MTVCIRIVPAILHSDYPRICTHTFQDVKMQVDNPQETVEKIKQGEIDESLYSRQLWVSLS